MTNKEAINWLTRIRDRLMTTSSKQFEAMTIAIAALEKQEVDKCCETCKYKDRNVKAELKYCGAFIRNRKEITNQDLRFYAWLFRAALREIEKLEEDNG